MAHPVVTTFNVYVSYYAVGMAFWVLGTLLLIKRRHLFPIVGQLPPLLLLQNAAYYVVFHGCAIPLLYPQINCFTAINVTCFGGMIAVMVVIFRRIALLFRLEIQKNMTELRAGGQMSWWTTNRRFFKPKPMIMVAGAVVIVGYIPIVIATSLKPHQFHQTCYDIGMAPEIVAVISYVILTHATFMVIQGVLAKKLAKHPTDSFGGAISLKLNSVAVMLLSLGMIIFTAVVPAMESMFQVAFFLIPSFTAFILTWLPVLSTFRAKFALLKIDLKSVPFEDLLLTDEGYAAFAAYLQREFSQENLLFYADTSAFLTTLAAHASVLNLGKGSVFPSCLMAERGMRVVIDKRHDNESHDQYQHRVISELLKAAENIYLKHVSETSPFQVNLSSQLTQRLVDNLQKARERHKTNPSETFLVLGELFLEARQSVMRLMRQDSFPRFVLSPAFQELESHGHKVRVTIVAHGTSASSENGDSAIAVTLKNWADIGALDRSGNSSKNGKLSKHSKHSKHEGSAEGGPSGGLIRTDSQGSKKEGSKHGKPETVVSTDLPYPPPADYSPSHGREPLSARMGSGKFASHRSEHNHKTASHLIEMGGVPRNSGGPNSPTSVGESTNRSFYGNKGARGSESDLPLLRAAVLGNSIGGGLDEISPSHNPLASNTLSTISGLIASNTINNPLASNTTNSAVLLHQAEQTELDDATNDDACNGNGSGVASDASPTNRSAMGPSTADPSPTNCSFPATNQKLC